MQTNPALNYRTWSDKEVVTAAEYAHPTVPPALVQELTYRLARACGHDFCASRTARPVNRRERQDILL